MCLFQETTWNPKNSYILICNVHSEEAGPHLLVLKRRKLIRKYTKCWYLSAGIFSHSNPIHSFSIRIPEFPVPIQRGDEEWGSTLLLAGSCNPSQTAARDANSVSLSLYIANKTLWLCDIDLSSCPCIIWIIFEMHFSGTCLGSQMNWKTAAPGQDNSTPDLWQRALVSSQTCAGTPQLQKKKKSQQTNNKLFY